MWIVDIVLVIVAFAIFFWPVIRLRMVAKPLDNEEFAAKIAENAQLVDVREPAQYRRKHIKGARNIPQAQLDQSIASFRKDKDILLYENSRPQLTTRVASKLKKAGYQNIYILRSGMSKWDGKFKEN